MVVLGGRRFLMSEVPLYMAKCVMAGADSKLAMIRDAAHRRASRRAKAGATNLRAGGTPGQRTFVRTERTGVPRP